MLRWVLVTMFAVSLNLASSTQANADGAYGVVVPKGSRSMGKAQFRSSKDWDRTLRFFRQVFRSDKGIVFQLMKSPPSVKAYHIQNINRKRTWDSVNIYENKQKVYISILPAQRLSGKTTTKR
ncbi:MAG: hypothetical protein VYC39_11005 [Myxococcota bacterium]|nr:hypothetical protein [Myxococcota bacterium]